jgi:hypothetical protein
MTPEDLVAHLGRTDAATTAVIAFAAVSADKDLPLPAVPAIA